METFLKNIEAIIMDDAIIPNDKVEAVKFMFYRKQRHESKLKNLGEGEAGTGYPLLSDGWHDGRITKPNDREEIILCECIKGMNDEIITYYYFGIYREDMDCMVEANTNQKYNINDSCYVWGRITAPSF